MRPLDTGIGFVGSLTLHVMLTVPLLVLSWLAAPEVDEEDDGVEVWAEGDVTGTHGLLVDDAVLTVTVLGTEMDWKATEVTPDPTAAQPAPTPAPKSGAADKKDAASKTDAEKTPDGTKQGDEGAEGGADVAEAGTGDNKPNPQAQRSSGKGKPCAVNPDIAWLETWKWGIERDLVELYAKDTNKLNRLARVTSHETKDGKPDGFRISMGRCSILKQAGLKTGDVVKDVNGRKIHNLFQAVGAYFTLRKEKDFIIHVDRKGSTLTLRYRVDHGAARNAKPMTQPATP